jgi:hypothetical protein
MCLKKALFAQTFPQVPFGELRALDMHTGDSWQYYRHGPTRDVYGLDMHDAVWTRLTNDETRQLPPKKTAATRLST